DGAARGETRDQLHGPRSRRGDRICRPLLGDLGLLRCQILKVAPQTRERGLPPAAVAFENHATLALQLGELKLLVLEIARRRRLRAVEIADPGRLPTGALLCQAVVAHLGRAPAVFL